MTTAPTDQTKIELIGKDIAYIQKDIASINTSIKELAGVYITKIQFEDLSKQIERRVIYLERSSNLWKWLAPTLSSILTAVVTFLLIQYLQNYR